MPRRGCTLVAAPHTVWWALENMTGAASLRTAGIASERAGSIGIAQIARDCSRSLRGRCGIAAGSRRIAAGIPVAPLVRRP